MSVPPDVDEPRDAPADERPAADHFDPVAPAVGQMVGDRYRIVAAIARGGMARVYHAHDVRLDRDVAVKILAEAYASKPAFADRFLAEARAVAALSHPNLVHVYDSGSTGPLRYIVMELLEGYRSLRALLSERSPLAADEATRISRDLLAGLTAVHEHGLVHCDVKAGNVMVGPGPTKLIDFGIARAPHIASTERTSLGSLHAMPPEQLRGDELTPASDVFAVGAVLYVALTGRVPFPGDDPEQVVASQSAGRPRAPSEIVPGIPPALDAVVLQALDVDPRHRFQTARAMSRALEVATGAPTPSHATAARGDETTRVVAVAPPAQDAPPRRARPARRPAGMLLAILALAAVAVAIVGIGLARQGAADRAAGPSRNEAGAGATPTLAAGSVRVPDTIGLSEADGEAKARAAHLSWTIRWQQTSAHQPGIYDQEPRPGEVVTSGSRFTMFAYRPAD